MGQVTVDQNGNFEHTFQVPRAPQGPHTVRVDTETVTFTVNPGITLSPTSGPAGSDVQIEGDGFPANQGNIRFQFGPQTHDPVAADPEGSIRTSFQVPDLAAGSYQVRVGSAPTVNFTISESVQILFPATLAGRAMIDGEPAPDEALVVAAVGNVKVGSALVIDGKFAILIAPRTADDHRGHVSFLVGGMVAVPDTDVILAPGVEAMGIVLRAGRSITPPQILTVTPSSGVPGRTVLTVRGRGYAPSRNHPVIFGANDQIEQVRVNPYGNFEVFSTVPTAPQGTYTVRVDKGEAAFTVVPGITLSNTSGTAGLEVRVEGDGFQVNQGSIQIRFGDLLVGTFQADESGAFRSGFIVPDMPPGSHIVTVDGAAACNF